MRRWMIWLIWMLMLGVSSGTYAACTLEWDPVTLNDDASPVNSTITYRIYRSSTHQGYSRGTPFTTTTATSTACATVAPAPGPWYVAVTALKDTNGLESVLFSNELSPPAAPGGIGAR